MQKERIKIMALGQVTTASDIAELVTQLMELEQDKLNLLQEKRDDLSSRKSSYTSVDTSLESLQTTLDALQKSSTFQARTASSTDTSTVTASTTTNASETVYSFSGIVLATRASAQSSAALGLSSETYTTLTSTAEMTTGAGSPDVNATIDSGSMNTDGVVTAGTFSINDKNIVVVGSDTIMTILTKINNSGAGVTASYDSGTETITLESNEAGATDITLGTTDTSNFLTAANLVGATQVDGELAEYLQSIDNTPLNGTIVDGYFTINGFTFSVDSSNDSIQTILNRINSSQAGVSAFYDEVDDTIILSSKDESEDIVLENDTAGFFSGTNIATGTHTGTDSSFTLNGSALTRSGNTFTIAGTTFTLMNSGSATVTVSLDKDTVTSKISAFISQFNNTKNLMAEETDTDGNLKNEITMETLLRNMKTRVYNDIDNIGAYDSLIDIGITYNSDGDLELDTSRLEEVLNQDSSSVFNLFAYDSDGDGLYDDGGFAKIFDDDLEIYTNDVTGFIADTTERIQDRIDDLDEDIEDEEARLEDKSLSLFDELVEVFNTINALNAQIQNLNTISANISLVSGGNLG